MADGVDELAQLLRAAEAAPPTESVAVITKKLHRRFDASSVSFLLTDLLEKVVIRLGLVGSSDTRREGEHIDLPGTIYSQVIRTQQLHQQPDDILGGYRLLIPVTSRGDCVGLLELTMPHPPDDTLLEQVNVAARALAYIIVTDSRFTDLYYRSQRSIRVNLAAEIQYQLLPSALTCEAPQFTVAGALEPAISIGGDTFDYTLDNNTVHLSITDAAGHNVGAALLATLLVSALRRARRAGATLAEQAYLAHQAVLNHGQDSMVTGQLLRIGLFDGRAELINAGHPWPFRLRKGQVEEVRLDVNLPFGAPSPVLYRSQNLDLLPGDRLIMITDGMLERGAEAAKLPALIDHTRHLHPRETVRVLAEAVVNAVQGALSDDATVMCLDWYGPHSMQHDAATGANLKRTSSSSRREQRDPSQ